MKISVITPTCERPVGIALCEQMMARQTLQPAEWIVADGGQTPARCTMGQTHVIDARAPGPLNFGNNLLNALEHATGELIVVVEDDDAYLPTHIEKLAEVAERGYSLIGSEDIQRYYNVASRSYRLMNNVGASLCQTAIRRSLLPLFRRTIQGCMARGSFGIDTTLWRAAGQTAWGFSRAMTVVGIKGLPGRVGLGVGHRPDARWTPDPDLAQLRAWIGADADNYAGFRVPRAA